MNWTAIPAGTINAAEQRLWVALGENADMVAAHINANPEFAQNLARFAINSVYKPSLSQELARAIMGANFFGIEEAIRHFGVSPSKPQIAHMAEIPFSKEVLQSAKDTHILVAVFPMSTMEIRDKVQQGLFYNREQLMYKNERFPHYKGAPEWHLVRKEPVADSMDKDWKEQQELLSKDEYVCRGQVLVYTIIGHFLATGERLFEKAYARCSDLDANDHQIIVGFFTTGGLNIMRWHNTARHSRFGLSASKKQAV